MKAFAVAILPLVLGVHAAQAATYPTELQGIWVPEDDRPKDGSRIDKYACDSFRKSGKHSDGMLIFEKTQMSAYGGYADYTDKNISVKKTGPSRWKIADRHYHDGEGDDRPGVRTVRYEVAVEGDLLKIKDKYGVHRYTRCPPPSSGSPGEKPKG